MIYTVLRVAAVVAGLLLWIINFSTYIKKKLTEKFTWLWTLFGFVLILSGLVPGMYDWIYTMNTTGYIAGGIIALLMVAYTFIITKDIADLKKKNRELAMHVSLLNQENERILARLEEMTGKTKAEI